jgi:hypothetical protein
VDDTLDGKASAVTLVETPDAAAAVSDSGVDLGPLNLSLLCPRAVLSDSISGGFTASALDGSGAPHSGLWVKLTPTTGTVRTAHEGGDNTDITGSVAFDYVAPHVDFDTTIGLTAEVIGANNDILATASCNFDVVMDAVRFIEPAPNSTVQFGEAVALSANLVIEGQPPLCSAGGGVIWSLKGPAGAGIALDALSPFTTELCTDLDAQGNPPPLRIGGATQGGSALISAQVALHTSELSVVMIGPPATLQLEADEYNVTVQSAANITAHVLDSAGQPVQGVTVLFELTRCAAATCAPGEAVSPTQVITGSNGVANAAYFSGATPGAAQISVRILERSTVATSLVVRVN